MELIEDLDRALVRDLQPLAESDQFAIFRVGSLMVDAMRHVYRDVASNLSPNKRTAG